MDIDTDRHRDFDAFASDELRKLLGEIHTAQQARPTVPALESLRLFAGNMRSLFAKMETAHGRP